jgi:hypothetical protein
MYVGNMHIARLNNTVFLMNYAIMMKMVGLLRNTYMSPQYRLRIQQHQMLDTLKFTILYTICNIIT